MAVKKVPVKPPAQQKQTPPPPDQKKLQAKFYDGPPEKKEKLTWKTFIIPAVLILIIIGFWVGERIFKGSSSFPEPNVTVEKFILEVQNLPAVRDNKFIVPNPMPDLSQFVTSDDQKWFADNYKKLAFLAYKKDVTAYNLLSDDEKKVAAMIFLAKDCPKKSVKEVINLKILYGNADYTFKTSDNLTYDAKLKKEGLNWKIMRWFGSRDRWEKYLLDVQPPDSQ